MERPLPKEPVHIQSSRLKLVTAVVGYAEFIASTPTSDSLEDILGRDYFGREVVVPTATERYNTKRIRPGDKITVRPDGMTWHLELVVTHVDATLNQCVTRKTNFSSFEAEHEFPEGWTKQFLGPLDHYGIFFRGELREKGLMTPDSAVIRARALHTLAGGSLDAPKPAPKSKARAKKQEPEAETEDA